MRKRAKHHLISLVVLSLFGILCLIKPGSVQAATNLVADIASYQSSDLAFFQQLKQRGVKAVTVKLTQGDWYINPKAAAQIVNAKKAGLLVNAYHYAEFNSSTTSNSPVAEAAFFVKQAKLLGISTDRVLALDIEDKKNSANSSVITKDINTFTDYVQGHGYSYTSTYSMRSWFSSKLIKVADLHDKNLWIAEYGADTVGFQPCGTWQYTDKWDVSGYGKIDMSYDYDGRFTTINKGDLNEFTANQTTLKMRGWHISNEISDYNYRYLIIMDAETNKEIKRIQISSLARPDVQRVYPSVDNSLNSGFDESIAIDAGLAGKKVFVIDRYTKDPAGSKNYLDFWFRSDTITIPKKAVNVATLEKFTATDATIQVAGWHASDEAQGRNYRYLIFMDADTNKEIKRVRIANVSRPDIKNKYPNVYNSGNSGFNTSVAVDASLTGKRVFVIDRYTSDQTGSKDYSDYWFRANTITVPKKSVNIAALEKFMATGSTIQVSGWHASDDAQGRAYRYLIFMDADTNREIKRVRVTSGSRADVQSKYPNVYNSLYSGFATSLPVDASLAGKRVFVIDRYTSDATGSKDYSDYWFRANTIAVPKKSMNVATLEKFSVTGTMLQISGWHASDEAQGRNYRFLIIMNADTNKEIKRVRISNNLRPDVQKEYPSVYNSLYSGFSTSLSVDASLAGRHIFVIDRYAIDATGNKDYADYWFRNQSLKIANQ
ncbi:GH25 family lysozyme [Lapidilactobacillus luobeiensis]|uniref:GH25 family lysozyme n=1 Tax=Lapidilactobacillus luobeiensis TaxID=2950371 RepID=UPI0021C328BF|nr:GH25 family lysozyme [Lapidilactobacillus luobeiensis]